MLVRNSQVLVLSNPSGGAWSEVVSPDFLSIFFQDEHPSWQVTLNCSCHPCQGWWQGQDRWCLERGCSTGLWPCPSQAHQARAALEISQQRGGKARGSCTELLWSTLTRQNISPCLHFSLVCNSGVIVSHFAVRDTWLTTNTQFREAGNPPSQKQL